MTIETPRIQAPSPVPKKRRGDYLHPWIDALAAARIGENVLVPYLHAYQLGGYMRRHGAGWYTARAEGTGCRIWKTAEPTHFPRSPPLDNP
jgi:hypothetical protein